MKPNPSLRLAFVRRERGLKCLKAALGISPGTSTYSSFETQNCKIKKENDLFKEFRLSLLAYNSLQVVG